MSRSCRTSCGICAFETAAPPSEPQPTRARTSSTTGQRSIDAMVGDAPTKLAMHEILGSRHRAAPPPRVDEGARALGRLALLRREEADPRREPEHDLRGGSL